MAMACLGFVTLRPLLPLRSLPCFISCISVSTMRPALGLYLRREDLARDAADVLREVAVRRVELRALVVVRRRALALRFRALGVADVRRRVAVAVERREVAVRRALVRERLRAVERAAVVRALPRAVPRCEELRRAVLFFADAVDFRVDRDRVEVVREALPRAERDFFVAAMG